MGYTGQQVSIPLGQAGLITDDPPSQLPINALSLANNVSLFSGAIEKSLGTIKLNSSALPSPIVGVFDWWPTATAQRTIAVTEAGVIYRETGGGTFSSITTGLGTLTPDTHLVAGGAEQSGNNKKLFIFTGTSQVQVISGDASSTTALSSPSADWSGSSYPKFGIVYQGRMCVMNTPADPHRIYFSTIASHEDFTTSSPPTFSIFPGEFSGIKCAAVYRGMLFIFKDPQGVYILDGRDPSTSNWSVSRYSDSFGVSSPHAVIQVLGDLIAGNSIGSFTSLQASDAFGDFEAGDILQNAKVESYIRSQLNVAGLPYMQSLYWPEKKIALFTGQSSSLDTRDRMLMIDVGRQNPRVILDSKERPNCLALRKNTFGIQKPMYGAADGYVYLMDSPTYNRADVAYLGEFQTVYTDFSQFDPSLAGKNKIFDFIEINYIPTGTNDFSVGVYVDGSLRQTLSFNMDAGAVLGSFVLDVDRLVPDPIAYTNRKPLYSCTGKRISFRIYNSDSNEAFKVDRIIIYFRTSAEEIYSVQI